MLWAQQGFICNDLRVLLGVGGGGGDIQNLQQVVSGFFFIVYAGLLHLIHDRDRVNVHGIVEHGVDGGEDVLILLEIKIVGLDLLQHVSNTAGINEHGANDCLLGLQRMGHLPGQQFIHAASPPVRNSGSAAQEMRMAVRRCRKIWYDMRWLRPR